MASMRLLAGLALLLASQQLAAAQAAPQLCTLAASVLQQCAYPMDPQQTQATCCSPFSVMLDLNCFCDSETQSLSTSVLSLDVLQGIDLGCGVAAMHKIQAFCSSEEAAELLSTDSAAYVASTTMEDADTRPVLDLSKVEDSVASLFQQGGEERGVTVTYREATDVRGENTYSVDVDVPNDLDVDLDLEVDLPESAGSLADSEVTVSVAGLDASSTDSVTLELSDGKDPEDPVYMATFYMDGAMVDEVLVELSDLDDEVEAEIDLDTPATTTTTTVDLSDLIDMDAIHEAKRAIPCAHAVENASTAASGESNPDLDFDINLELPEGLLGQFQGRDVSIEMEYSLAQGAAFNSAEITVEDGVPEASFNGKAIGNMLKEAANYMASELSIPMQPAEDQDLPELTRKETLLGGALQFLAEIGEDISLSIPNRQLHDGDFIEIERKEEEVATVGSAQELLLAQSKPAADRRSLERLAEAIQATLFEDAQPEGAWVAKCSVCALVDKYLYVLWGFVAGGLAILCYYGLLAVLSRSNGSLTDSSEELRQPLIVHAADFASEGSKEALLLPIWSPAETIE